MNNNSIVTITHEIEEENTTKKVIYNPVTDTYYEIRQRNTKHGKKGEIKGKWKRDK